MINFGSLSVSETLEGWPWLMELMALIASRKAAEIQFQPREAFIYMLGNNNNTNLCFPSACQALC